jgi:hypothetical protein
MAVESAVPSGKSPDALGQRTLRTARKISTSPAVTPRRSIRRTENISPGVRKRAPASKPINGGSWFKIENQEKRAI